MPRPSSPQTTFVCEFQSLNSHLVKISCVCMIIGLAVGAIAVAEPKPQADPTIPRDELKKLVAAALADRYWARSDHPIPAARMERMEYVGAKSQQLNVPQQFISGDGPSLSNWTIDQKVTRCCRDRLHHRRAGKYQRLRHRRHDLPLLCYSRDPGRSGLEIRAGQEERETSGGQGPSVVRLRHSLSCTGCHGVRNSGRAEDS
jgi:hypothetical protein